MLLPLPRHVLNVPIFRWGLTLVIPLSPDYRHPADPVQILVVGTLVIAAAAFALVDTIYLRAGSGKLRASTIYRRSCFELANCCFDRETSNFKRKTQSFSIYVTDGRDKRTILSFFTFKWSVDFTIWLLEKCLLPPALSPVSLQKAS